MENKSESATDCRAENGITVGLIDALISIARVLVKRDFNDAAVQEALKDLATDEDVAEILRKAKEA
jgi:hypothetical protein